MFYTILAFFNNNILFRRKLMFLVVYLIVLLCVVKTVFISVLRGVTLIVHPTPRHNYSTGNRVNQSLSAVAFMASDPAAILDADLKSLVRRDDEDNVYFDIYTLRGPENKIMYAKNGVLLAEIQSPENIQDTFEKQLWNFMAYTLAVNTTDFEILMFPTEAARRVLLKKGRLTQDECADKIRDVLKPYIPQPSQSPGQTEPPPLLPPYDPLAVYAHNDTNQRSGPIKYYALQLAKENRTGHPRTEAIPRKRLVELRPYYNKDPSWTAKIMRDLKPEKEVVVRGRLMPGVPSRPLLDDYRGHRRVRLTRKILQGIADGSGIPPPDSKPRFEMSLPVPALMMLDFLNAGQDRVVSRRVISPVFRNDTLDLVEELEYVDVSR